MHIWEWREHAWKAMERGRFRATVQKRIDGPVWNLHLHELPWPTGLFRYISPETAMKHGTRWLDRHPQPSVAEVRQRTDAMFTPERNPDNSRTIRNQRE